MEEREYIDLVEVAGKIWSKRRLFFKAWAATFVISCVWIFSQPRKSVSTVIMVPEVSSNEMGVLSSLAVSVGLNLGNIKREDAYYPELYPSVISSNEFLVDLLPVRVKTIATDNKEFVESSYLDHLTVNKKKNWIGWPFQTVIRFMKGLVLRNETEVDDTPIDPYRLSEKDNILLKQMKKDICSSVDKKTNVITITVWDQDGQVAATIADTVCTRLQNFITEYRTHKARVDLECYIQLQESAYKEYKEASLLLSQFSDSHKKTNLQKDIVVRNELANNLSLKQTAMNAIVTQVEAAKARLQEKTPAFTILSKSGVPCRPTKPSRLRFVITMLLLVTCGIAGWIFKNEIIAQLRRIK